MKNFSDGLWACGTGLFSYKYFLKGDLVWGWAFGVLSMVLFICAIILINVEERIVRKITTIDIIFSGVFMGGLVASIFKENMYMVLVWVLINAAFLIDMRWRWIKTKEVVHD
jgi:hypothetical protein